MIKQTFRFTAIAVLVLGAAVFSLDANAQRVIRLGGGQYTNFVDSDGDGVCDADGAQAGSSRGARGIRVLTPRSRSQNADGTCNLTEDALAAVPLTEAETASVLYMREEEKVARDVYMAMYNLWGNTVFTNIARSEQNHMDAIKKVIDAQGLADPIQDAGIFSNADLQALYDTLVLQGSASELEALKVGALIEEVDIEDLQNAIAEAENENLISIYTSLMNGSENHLRAFVRRIELYGETYTAQHLPQEEVDAILAADTTSGQGGQARGGRGGRGF